MMDPCQPMVKLSVGTKPNIVLVHQGVLCQSSQFFQKAIKPEWAERRKEPNTIDLSEDSSTEVITYVRWLYTGNIDIQMTQGKLDESRKKEAETNFDVLVRAYVFSEKILDSTFVRKMLEKLIEAQNTYAWTPGPDVFCILYSGTSAGCPGRRLMTQFVAHNAHFQEHSEWGTYLDGFPRELLIDVIKAMSSL